MINLLTKVAIIVGNSLRIVCFVSIITKFEFYLMGFGKARQ